VTSAYRDQTQPAPFSRIVFGETVYAFDIRKGTNMFRILRDSTHWSSIQAAREDVLVRTVDNCDNLVTIVAKE